ncbi:VCBS domain-containing protein [Vibrio sp. F13]|uniref:VCBS domain-containing protein n=18 Tax=Vibrio TaxID=662 RepID=UPI0039B65540
MANKKNVEANKKNTEIKNKKSNELEQKKPTQKKKRRLHSHLKVNIPLFQSLMMILPSLAKHAAAESIDNASDAADQVTANNVTEKDVTDDHSKADSSAVALQDAQASDNDVNSTLSASHAAHGSSSNLVPSHHLSTLSHPQVHYIPSVSMPTISSGSNGQPTHSNAPTTPALPVTFMPEVIKGTYGELHVDANGQYTFVLNPNSPQYILLNQHQPGTDHFALHLSNGSSIIVQIPVTGKQDTPNISGDLTGVVTEDHNIDSQGLLHANGKIDVIDPDQNESSVTPEVISGKYGSLTIDADGHWQYQVDNSLSNVQALTAATSLHESFTIHTKDGTPQTIDMTIGGNDDNAVITGVDAGTLTEDLTTQVQGQLSVTDSDLGEDHFQASQVTSNFGTLSITKDGAWTYSLDNNNPVVQRLGQGSTATDIVTVHSADGTPHQVTITVNGTNDTAVISGTNSGAVTEESQLKTSGTLTITDTDKGEDHFSNTDIAGQLGTLHLKDNGNWTYDLDNTNPTVQALAQGSKTTDIITVHSADGTPHQITVTVNGTNDKAVIAGTNSGAVTEESQLQTSGTLTITDTDTGEAHFSNTDIAGQLGTLHLKDNGDWTYDLDNTNPTVQALAQGSKTTDIITVHSADGTPHQITVTVNGTNDKAVIAGTNSGAVTEESQLQTSGTLTITDTDTGEAHFSNTDIAGQLGTLHLKDNGDWTYDLDNTNPTVQALAQGSKTTDIITVHSADGTPHQITVTVNGTNDKAVIAGTNSGAVTEESQLQTSGTLTITDTDTGEAHFSNTDIAGQLGTLHLKDNGDWTYDLDNTNPTVQALAQGSKTTDIITVHSGDGTPHQVTITVNGTNNAAIIGGVDTASISENTAGVNMSPDYAHSGIATLGNTTLYADGKLTITDPDVGESGFERQGSNGYDYHGTYGDLILLTDGTWHYHADAGHLSGIGARPTTRGTAIDQLGEGQSLTDTITVHSKDGTTHDIVITIHGSNDRPYCSSEVVLANGSEDTRQTLTTAQLLANTVDVDANDAGKLTIENLHVDHGSILNNADGTFTFTPEKDYNGDVHFSYDVKDAHGGVTHTGATTNLAAVNDNPDVTPLTDSVSEGADNHHTLNLLVGATDKDGDALTISHLEYAIDGQLQAGKIPAGITLDTDGHTLIVDATDPAFNHLANGQSQQIAITYQVEDGHGGSTQQTATLTIAGTDDKATLVSNVIQLTETQALDSEFKSYRGQLQLIDPDSGDNTQFVFSGKYLGQGFAPGHLDVWPNGTYQFKLDAGTNHHPDDLISSLHAGESMELPYEVETTDGQKLTIMVKVTGEDNQAKIAVTPYSSLNNHVYEDHTSFGNTTSQLSSGGTLQVIDPDHDQAGFIAQTITTAEGGRFNINAQGQWSYDIDNDKVQHLGAGESFQQTFTVESIDGSAKKDITVTVHGTNDAPVASAEVRLANGLEDTQIVLTPAQLLANSSDVDDNDIGKLSIENLQADHGAIALNADGTFTFTPEKDYNGDVHFSYDVKDAHGGVTHTGASTTLSAAGDKAQIAGVDTGSITENSAGVDMSPDYAHSGIATLGNTTLYADGKLTITDPDVGESGFERQGSNGYDYHGTYGDLILLTDGTWHYHADAGHLSGIGARPTTRGTAIDQLGEGQSLTDTITVHSKDGTTHDIVITIHGSNDRPYCSSEVVLANGSEDTRQTLTTAQLLANTVDVDSNDAGKLTIENLHVDHGSILNNADGTFTFTPEKDYNGDVHFSYDVKDAHGGVTHTSASTTLSAVGDKAQIAGVDTGSITENSAGVDMSPDYAHSGIATLGNTTLYADGKLTITDPDVGESGFERQGSNGYDYHGTYGDLILLTDGTWHYHADAGHLSGIGARPTTRGTAIDQLGEGQSLTDTITVHSKDGTTHDIVITIHGSNDRPYCSSEVVLANGSEDTRQTLTTAQLLANTVDVDSNDAGKLTIENLHADHGSILNNADGTFTFTPEKDYNGDVHFSYDVKDAHGGITHTGATTNLAAVNDTPDVTPLTDSVSEGADNHHTLNLLVGATDKDGDALTISHLEYAIDGQPQSGQRPTGITLDTDGHTLIVDATNPAFNHLANGQSQQIAITYQVEDGHGGSTQQTATLTIAGTDDKATLVSNVIQLTETQALDSEFKSYRGQLQLIDPDSGDNTQFVFSGKYLGQGFAPGHLDVWPNGTYQFKLDAGTNHHPDDLISSLHAGESMELPYEVETTDGQKLTIMVKVTGEDNQAKIAVTPYSSLNNHVYEDHTSFGNTTNQLSSGGTLQVIDPDHDQAGFIAQTITTTEGGQFNINAQGHWSYNIDNDKVQHLGAGESFQQTFTVESIDGSAKKDITVTVHGTNDAPVASAEVRLANGLEDTQIVLTPAQLLANSSDVDDNDIGKLSIENLQADHGAIALNADGTFTFTPEKDYNGDVHFSYDVKDAHGGVTHTGASTTLSAAGDAAIFTGDKSGQITEDRHVQGDAQHTIFVTGVLNVIDPDASEDHFYATRNAHAVSDPYGGHLTIGKAGDWAYSVPNANIQHLAAGQVEQVQYEVTTAGGDKQIITINVHGTNDKPTVSEAIAGAHNIDEDAANATSGQIIISDVDHSDQHSVSIDSQHQPQYGSVTYNSNTQTWVYTLNNSNSHVNALNNGEQLTDKFSLLVDDGHGGITTQEVEMRIDGHSDVPPMPTLVAPAKITGSAGNQDLHASIGIPPIIHQGTPTPMTGWGISDHHGHSLTTLHGQFGTLHVNPATGELSYDYQQTSSGVVKTHTGGSYGSGTDETDSFVLTLGGDQNSQVAVHLHLHSQSVHGNSGHHIDQTTLTGMDLSPIAPSPPPAPGMSQADEPDASFSTPDEVTLNFDEVTANLEHTAIGEHEQRSGAHAYLDALGINADSPSIDSPSHNVPVAHDIDIIFSDAESAYGAEQTDDGMSDGLSHHTDNPSIDDSLHHHNDVDGLPDIDPNN